MPFIHFRESLINFQMAFSGDCLYMSVLVYEKVAFYFCFLIYHDIVFKNALQCLQLAQNEWKRKMGVREATVICF